jgi:hypothetical protein
MEKPRYMPIGIQDFEKLRKSNCVYVDKTEYVWTLVSDPAPYFLSRPRRFGKSLLLTTLKAYFLGKRELFEGLAIAKRETEWEEYPVLHLDFNPARYDSADSLNRFIGSRGVNTRRTWPGSDPAGRAPGR